MSTPKNEDLAKSIDTLLDEVFSEPAEQVEKSIDIAGDAKTTADAALSGVPSSQKDEARGAGRPKQISDVPQTDMDGRRESEYDGAIADAKKEDEPEETDQSPSIDQTSGKGRMGGKPAAPKVAPFKKSIEVTDEELKEFEEFKKAKSAEAEKAAKAEELRKSEELKKSQEELIKSAVREATSQLARENAELRKSFTETQALIKAMAEQPVRAKSITGIEVLEKSIAPEDKGPQAFTREEVLDAAFELAKSGKIPSEVVSEIEMTKRTSNADARMKIEKYLEGKN